MNKIIIPPKLLKEIISILEKYKFTEPYTGYYDNIEDIDNKDLRNLLDKLKKYEFQTIQVY